VYALLAQGRYVTSPIPAYIYTTGVHSSFDYDDIDRTKQVWYTAAVPKGGGGRGGHAPIENSPPCTPNEVHDKAY